MKAGIKTEDIRKMIQKTPAVQPPEDFTDRVMDRIGLSSPHYGPTDKIVSFFTQSRSLNDLGFLAGNITKRQCGYYFIFVGLFYFIVGLVFSRSLEAVSSTGYQTMWLPYQPEFSFAVAIGFALFGISFIASRSVSIGLYKFGIFIYVGLVIINSMVLQMDMNIPVVAFALLPLTIGSVIIGWFLFYVIDRYSHNFIPYKR